MYMVVGLMLIKGCKYWLVIMVAYPLLLEFQNRQVEGGTCPQPGAGPVD